MLTLVALPKAFKGHFAVIQRNAIQSWTRLEPKPEIILLGDESGVAEACLEFGLRHVPEVHGGQDGPPLLNEVLARTQQAASHNLICYVNADIILLSDFLRAVRTASAVWPKFLMVGRRWDVKIDHSWDFSAPNWEQELRQYVLQKGMQVPPPGNSDYFVFPRGFWGHIPPLAIGRGWWDHWLVYEARRLGSAVLDASPSVTAVHQIHDHLLGASASDLRRWRAMASANLKITGPDAKKFTLLDSTHVVTSRGIKQNKAFRHFVRALDTLPLFHPTWGLPFRICQVPLKLARLLADRYRRYKYPSYRLLGWVVAHLPENGLVGVLGLADADDGDGLDRSRGYQLAHGLIWGGYPAILYDPIPRVLQRARRDLRGPVTFGSSVQDCLRESDILLLAANREGIRTLLVEALRGGVWSRSKIVDCCGILQTQELAGKLQGAPQPEHIPC